MSYLAETDPDLALGPLRATACTYRIGLGPRAGRKVLSLQTAPAREPPLTPVRCVNEQGFSLHTEVSAPPMSATSWPGTGKFPAWRAEDATLCRYITRPAIANERLTLNRAGDVVLQLKSLYHDATTHVVMSPLEFMQRLAALVPRPRLHLIRFHGVLAPNAKLRPEIVPNVPVNANTPSVDHAEVPPPAAPAPMNWARLLKRVFEIDLEHCPHCGGPLTIIATIEHPLVIAKMLAHLGLPARAPPDRPRGHSTDSKWPDPSPRPPPTRFHSLTRQPPLAGTRPRGQNAPGSRPFGPRKGPKHPHPGPTVRVIDNPQVHWVLFLSSKKGL